jgi:hypothetical protein
VLLSGFAGPQVITLPGRYSFKLKGMRGQVACTLNTFKPSVVSLNLKNLKIMGSPSLGPRPGQTGYSPRFRVRSV